MSALWLIISIVFCIKGAYSSCEKGFFRCNQTGECIHSFRVCNHLFDCKDGTDEIFCPHNKHLKGHGDSHLRHRNKEALCSGEEFRCINASWCINAKFHCDGYVDCPDYSDEYNCTGINKNDQYSLPFNRLLAYAMPPLLIFVMIFFCHRASRRKRTFDQFMMRHQSQEYGEVQNFRDTLSTNEERTDNTVAIPVADSPGIQPMTILPPKYEEAMAETVYNLPENLPPDYSPPQYDLPQTGACSNPHCDISLSNYDNATPTLPPNYDLSKEERVEGLASLAPPPPYQPHASPGYIANS